MSASTGVIERSLAFVGVTAVVAAAMAGGTILIGSVGLAVDDSMESSFDDESEPAIDGT